MVTKVKRAGFQTDHHKMETDFCLFSSLKLKKVLRSNHTCFYLFILFCVLFRSDCSRMSSGSKYSFTHTEVRQPCLLELYFHKVQNENGQN